MRLGGQGTHGCSLGPKDDSLNLSKVIVQQWQGPFRSYPTKVQTEQCRRLRSGRPLASAEASVRATLHSLLIERTPQCNRYSSSSSIYRVKLPLDDKCLRLGSSSKVLLLLVAHRLHWTHQTETLRERTAADLSVLLLELWEA